MLGLNKQPQAWHVERFVEEQQELLEAKGAWERLSEQSDVFFTIIRAEFDGHPLSMQLQI
jgi:hypothetical protein